MRIAYVAHWAENARSGVTEKILTQVTHWRSAGNDVSVFLIVPNRIRLDLLHYFGDTAELFTAAYDSPINRPLTTLAVAKAIRSWNPDIVYSRQMFYHPALHWLATKFPLVIEINTNDAHEAKLGTGLRSLFNKCSRNLVYSKCQGMVCVTKELADCQEYAGFKKSRAIIANGIDLKSARPMPPTGNSVPTLAFLGSSGQSWHGVDKVAWLAQQRPDWSFHVVGPGISELGRMPASNLTMHGYLEHSRYRQILAQSDVAIGTLALHRKGMNEACPLKVREYLAAGIPTIIGYDDTDFPDEVPFILRLPNVEKNIDLRRVEQFVGQWQNERIDLEDIAHLDISAKEIARLQFLQSILA